MLIGELVQKSGLSKDTIRFYEKQKLIQVNRKERRSNNYKEYSEEILTKLLTIKTLKSFGFTLTECSDVLDLIEEKNATCENIADKIASKVSLLDQKISEMIQIRKQLLNASIQCKKGCISENPSLQCDLL